MNEITTYVTPHRQSSHAQWAKSVALAPVEEYHAL